MPLWEAQSILAGPVGTEIKMQVIRLAQKSQLSFALGEVPPLAVELSESRGLGVLRIASLDSETVKNVGVSLETLNQGSEDLAAIDDRSRLVIDLRGVAGGSPAAAYGVAELFTEGELGVLINRAEVLEVFAAQGATKWSGRLAVLVDHGTLGAAELLATILKQNMDAILVGEPTFGHTGRESLVPLSNGGGLQITDAFYTGPDREPISSSLTPDRRVSSRLLLGGRAAEDGDGVVTDPILEKALEVLLDEEEAVEKKAA
jgi:carboxyl-terminal processing protease